MRLFFDIGATNTRLGVSRDGARIERKIMFPSSPDFYKGIEDLSHRALELTQGRSIDVAVGGIAGPLDKAKQKIISPGNIPGWHQKPVKFALEGALNTRVFLENDTALVGLGEAIFGAGKGCSILAYVTLSSGFGATRIVDGKVDVACFGFEPAFQIVGYNESDTTFQPHHYLRYHVSGASLKTKYGLGPAGIKDPQIWDQVARWIAAGINNVIVFWSPERIVFGGPILQRVSLGTIIRYAREAVVVFPELPVMIEAELGDYGGLYGALQLSNTSKNKWY